MVANFDTDQDAKPTVQLDLGRGPTTRSPIRSWKQKVKNFIEYIPLTATLIMVFFYMILLAVGLRTPLHGTPLHDRIVGMAANTELGQELREASRKKKMPTESLLNVSIPQGYNCRGYCWVGDARVEAVWDSGASRNSIDAEFLKALVDCPYTSRQVTRVIDIEPRRCVSVSNDGPNIVVDKVAVINVCFREKRSRVVEKGLGFFVIPNSSESMLIGKPTLDALGFVSDINTIELRALGLQFPMVLRDPVGREGYHHHPEWAFLRLADHAATSPPAGRSTIESIELVTNQKCVDKEMWAMPGPDVPDNVQVVEGPVVPVNGRCSVDVIAHGPATMGPATKLVELREMTAKDKEILEGAHRAERHRHEVGDALLYMHDEAMTSAMTSTISSSSPPLDDECLLSANYKAKGKRERQQALFPELEREIESAQK